MEYAERAVEKQNDGEDKITYVGITYKQNRRGAAKTTLKHVFRPRKKKKREGERTSRNY